MNWTEISELGIVGAGEVGVGGGAGKEGRLALMATQSARRGAVAPSGPEATKGMSPQDDKASLGMTS
jgi:hypothetical protein